MAAIIRQGGRVLAHESGNLEARNAMASAWLGLAHLRQTELLAARLAARLGREVSPAQVWRPQYRAFLPRAFEELATVGREQVAASFDQALALYRGMQDEVPLSGLVCSAMGHALDEARSWRGQVQGREQALLWYDTALALYPWHSLVLRQAVQGYWLVWQETTYPLDRARIEERLLGLALRLGRLEPRAMAAIYPMIWRLKLEEGACLAVTPDNLAGQEALAAFFMEKELWPQALRALERMTGLNAARAAEETPQTLGNRGFLQRERRDRDVLARLIAERRVQVLGHMGDPAALAAAKAELQRLRAVENVPRLARVDRLMADGDYRLAEEVLKTMPDDAGAMVRLCEILFLESRFESFRRLLPRVLLAGEAGELDAESGRRLARLQEQAAARNVLAEPSAPVAAPGRAAGQTTEQGLPDSFREREERRK